MIEYYAFRCCPDLTFLTISKNVTEIGNYAFQECYSVTLIVEKESYAADWAENHEIPYIFPEELFQENMLNPAV